MDRNLTVTGRLLVVAGMMLALVKPVIAGTEGFGLGLEEMVPDPSRPPEEWPRVDPPDRGFGGQRPVELLPAPFYEPKPFLARLPGDFVGLVKAPVRWEGRQWRQFGLGVAAVGALALLDDEVNGWLDQRRSDGAVKIAEGIRPLGQEGALVLLGGAWLAGRQLDRPELTAMAQDGFESALFAAGVITPLLKAVTGRVRPRNTDSSTTFNGSSESFPSGETTMAFAVASVVAAHSNRRWIDALAWSTAGLVGAQRMVLDAHWASDVLAGALIGTAVGQWVVRRNRPEFASRLNMTVMPTFGAGSYGVSVKLEF